LKGKVAHCSGLHVNPEEALEAIKAKDIELPAARQALKDQETYYEGELKRANDRTDRAIEAFNGIQDVLSKAITDVPPLESPSILESPVFWGVTLFLVGTIAGGAAVLALE
jgi:hypothetical protein